MRILAPCPIAPRAGMDDKIESGQDIFGVPKYRKGLFNRIPILGAALGIEEETQSILNRNGTIDTQLLEILNRYIDEKSPTWSDFCTALKKNTLFKKVWEKIEADHCSSKANELKYPGSKRSQLASDDQQTPPKRLHSVQQEPGVADGDEPGALKSVRFAIITANENEWESAQFFMGLGKCIIKRHLKEHLIENNLIFSELFKADPDKFTVKFVENLDTYYLVRVGGVLGVLTECSKMGGLGAGQSFDTVTKLLDTAKEKDWELEAVFLVGCCGCASQKTNVLGTVVVADKIYSYDGGEFKAEGYAMQQPEPIPMAEEWVRRLRSKMANKSGTLLNVQKLRRAPFFSGCKMKDKNQSEELQRTINAHFLGFEMEGVGACLAAKASNLKTDILVVKGVSDQGDRYKNKPAPITFFSKKIQKVGEDSRQQMCTMMSLMVVFRAIIAKWGKTEKENPVAPS